MLGAWITTNWTSRRCASGVGMSPQLRAKAAPAQHPAVEARTARLKEGLTLERFVALGDALYNKTRKSMLEKQAPGNPGRQAEIAFDLLDE